MTDDDEALGRRPEGDALAREVARSKISDALFATGEAVSVGRYRLVQRIGHGGMGVVWGAWDPELERRVAIKLVRANSSAARAHMLLEGQALAKLSHPNVIPIYDVGTLDDQVYLVMEWVAGATLRAYCTQPRSVHELVAIYRAAGEGLVVAHRAGIVHRDFKPDNVMVGDDQRVRVLDFGLARTEGEARAAGTPRYMAPEQASGGAVTALADQFSFCVSLRESFETRGEVPAWIAAIATRGTALEPSERYPSLEVLLAALARDPARLWRRRGVVAAAVVATAAAFVVGNARGHTPETCTGAGDELARVWNPTARSALVDHVRTLGPYGLAEAGTLATQLGAYGDRWIAARRGACLAQHRDELTERLYERSLACLERSRAAFDATITAVTNASVDHLPNAVLALRDLPDAERCARDATTDPIAPPDRSNAPVISALGADATKASYLALAADPSAGPLARSTARAADALGYRPLIARAQLALGATLEQPDATFAIAPYAAAADAALAVGDDVMFVEAYARKLFAAGKSGDPRAAELVGGLPLVERIAHRTGDAGRFVRALLYNNAGIERLAAGDPKGARPWLRKARAEPEPDDRGVELWAILGNLAMVVEDDRERAELFDEERQRLERTLGPDHAFTLQERLRATLFVANASDAAARLRELCAAFSRQHPDRTDKIGACNYDLGWLAIERGDATEASTTFAVAASQLQPDPAGRGTLAKAQLALLAGDPHNAVSLATAVAADAQKETTWWGRFPAVDSWLVVAAARSKLGDAAGAVVALRAALTVLDDPRLNRDATYVQRRLARVRAQLALATHDRSLAAAAIAWYRTAGGYDAAIRELGYGL